SPRLRPRSRARPPEGRAATVGRWKPSSPLRLPRDPQAVPFRSPSMPTLPAPRFDRRVRFVLPPAALLAFLAFLVAPFAWSLQAQVPAAAPGEREVTILYTNDFHSAFDPIPAYWLPGSPKLGGAAHLATLVEQIRQREKTVFLFDTGDMFTGMLSNLTRGEALMEMMLSLRYDAM